MKLGMSLVEAAVVDTLEALPMVDMIEQVVDLEHLQLVGMYQV